MKHITVRPADNEDLAQLRELMLEYIVDFYQFREPEKQQLDGLINSLLTHQEGIQFVAEAGGQLVGFATLYFTFSTLQAAKIVVMNDLYVREAERGRGAAQKLFTECKEYAARNGYANMSWTTAADNARAQRFYDKMGGERGDWLTYSTRPTLGVGD